MKKIVLILLLLMFTIPVFSADIDGVFNVNKLTQAENIILGKTYEKQHASIRLNRLERTVFNKTFPRLSYEERINNIIVNYKANLQSHIDVKGLSKLERKIFHRAFDRDLTEQRISRLEQRVFGTIQNGDLDYRYKVLESAVPNYVRNSYMTELPYCSVPVIRSGWRNVNGPFGNFFTGYPTGMSPQINFPYLNNLPPDRERRFYSNNGWMYHNTHNGSGLGVHILD